MSTPAPRLSDEEWKAQYYYHGLPSQPRFVCGSSKARWETPADPEEFPPIKELCNVGTGQTINKIWEVTLAFEIHEILDRLGVIWTATDVFRIRIAGQSFRSSQIVLWIAVQEGSLSREAGEVVVAQCMGKLDEHHITDVEVEIREGEASRLVQFIQPSASEDTTTELYEGLAYTLGHSISALATAETQGTGGFYMRSRNDPTRLWLVGTRHVVLSPAVYANVTFNVAVDGLHQIQLYSNGGWQEFRRKIEQNVDTLVRSVKSAEGSLKTLVARNGDPAEERGLQARLEFLQTTLARLRVFRDQTNLIQDRVIGHLVFSPPMAFGVPANDHDEGANKYKRYTQDWALMELDNTVFDFETVQGNMIDLATSNSQLSAILHPNLDDRPIDHLLRLRGTISDEEMRHPTDLDESGEPCIKVIKRGATTGLTVGRANELASFVRYPPYNTGSSSETRSTEWAIVGYNKQAGDFSRGGDSGSVIADSRGRIGGLLTAGSMRNQTVISDTSYATPISFVLEQIGAKFPDLYLYDP